MTAVAEEKEAYRASFGRFVSRAGASDPAWLRERRTAAFARFVETGFPTPRDEAWRHTPVAPLTRGGFEPADPEARPARDVLGLFPGDAFRGPRLVVVNGRLSRELSTLDASTPGVTALSLRDALAARPAAIEPWLAHVAGVEAGAFSLLNTAFAEDGAVVLLAPGTVVEEPILVQHVGAGDGAASVSYARTLIVAGRGSECRIVESFVSPGGRAALTNAVSEIVVEDGAHVDRYKLQQEGAEALHAATLAARLGRDARFYDHSLTLGASLSRDDIDVRFSAEGGECVLNGLFMVDGRRVADTHSRIDHARPHCTSRELYKGILDGQARGVFNGLIVVRPGAQKTDAWQMNRNLLLSREALVHSTPQLQILADDVKCKHGSTTGQLDPAALFYLRSRGIAEAEARSLLTWAFANDLLRHVRVGAVRQAVARQLQRRLPGIGALAEAVS